MLRAGERKPLWPIAFALAALILMATPPLLAQTPANPVEPRYIAMGDNQMVIWTHQSGDTLVVVSKTIIATAFAAMWRRSKRERVPYAPLFLALSAAFAAAAISSALFICAMWLPIYHVTAAGKALHGIASAVAAFYLVYYLPAIRKVHREAQLSESRHEAMIEANASKDTELAHKDREQRILTQQLIAAETAHRNDLAEHVHDGPTQTATAAFRKVDKIRRHYETTVVHSVATGRALTAEDATSLKKDIVEATALNLRLQQELRDVLNDLRPAVLVDYGIHEAIAQKVGRLKKDGWNIYYHHPPNPEDLDTRTLPDVESALWRVFHESIENIRKHANATRVDVTLSIIPDHEEPDTCTAKLTIIDNGRGFDPEDLDSRNAPIGTQTGLRSRTKLIQQLGGKMSVISSPAAGTTVMAELTTQTSDQAREKEEVA